MATGTSTGKNINLKKVGGTATDTNSGNKSAGTLRVTLATDQVQLTNALKVDGSAVTQPVSNAGLTALNAAIAGTEVQVDVLTLPAIPAGTNNIGDVDVLTINGVAPAFGTGLRGATVQRVTIATDDSVPVTNAGITTIAGAVSGTEMQVDVLTMPSVTVTATDLDIRNLVAATDIVDLGGNALTSLQLIDDTVATLGTTTYTEAATKGNIIGAVRRDADTTLVDTTNEVAPLQVDARGALKVEVFSGETLPVSLTSTTITGTVAVTQSGTWDEVGINDSGNSITVDNSSLSVVGGGAEATAMRVTIANDSTGVLSVDDNGGSLTVDGTVSVTGVATLAEQQTQTASLSVMDDWDNAASDGASVSGDTAHDAIDAGEPVKVGYKAIAHGTNPTAVAASDRTNAYANRAGIPFFIGGHPNVIAKEFTVLAADGAQTNLALVSVSAGTKIVVTKIGVYASNANTVSVGVRVGFGTATLPAAALAGATGIVLTHSAVAAGSGVVEGNGSGIIGIGADDEDLRLTCDSPTTGSIRILVNYYTIES